MPYYPEAVKKDLYPTRAAYHFFGCNACHACFPTLGCGYQPLLAVRGMLCPLRGVAPFEWLEDFVEENPKLHDYCYKKAEPEAQIAQPEIATATTEATPEA
jgi:hypothetical protein